MTFMNNHKIIYRALNFSTCSGSLNLLCGGGADARAFALQFTSEIARKYKNSHIIHIDTDCSTTMERAKYICKFSDEEMKNSKYVNFQYRWIEEVCDTIKNIAEYKMHNPDKFVVNNRYIPTFIILDSMNTIESINHAITGDSIDRVVSITTKIQDTISYINEYNIVIFMIDHTRIIINETDGCVVRRNDFVTSEFMPICNTITYLSHLKEYDMTYNDDIRRKEIPLSVSVSKSFNKPYGYKFEMLFNPETGMIYVCGSKDGDKKYEDN